MTWIVMLALLGPVLARGGLPDRRGAKIRSAALAEPPRRFGILAEWKLKLQPRPKNAAAYIGGGPVLWIGPSPFSISSDLRAGGGPGQRPPAHAAGHMECDMNDAAKSPRNVPRSEAASSRVAGNSRMIVSSATHRMIGRARQRPTSKRGCSGTSRSKRDTDRYPGLGTGESRQRAYRRRAA